MIAKYPVIPEYKYRVKDYSIITPWFRETVVRPILAYVPARIPANHITVISNLFMFAALFLSMFAGENRLVFLAIPILILSYLIGDHLDGMQAKRTGTSSALGEFFDHFLDIFNNGILIMIMSNLMNVNPWVFAVSLAVSYIAHSAIFYEQLRTGWLVFEKFGALEAVLLLSLIIFSLFFVPVQDFLLVQVFGQLSYFELFMLFSSAIALVTWGITLIRIKSINFKYMAFVLGVIVLLAVLIPLLNNLNTFLIISLFSVVYIGNNQRSHLAGFSEKWPDIASPLLLLVSYLSDFYFTETTGLVIAYLSVRVLWIVYTTLSVLRKYWVWRNPEMNPSAL